jgi:hypothetical protein
MLSDADRAYVREQFVPLSDACAAAGCDVDTVRAEIAARRRAAPPYPGMEYVPANYLDLPDADGFRRAFDGPDPEAELESYLDGAYFVCVRDATVANIKRKEALVARIRELRDRPGPSLRTAVDELDALERPFSPDYDRRRFGASLTRDDLIAGVRARHPQLWA